MQTVTQNLKKQVLARSWLVGVPDSVSDRVGGDEYSSESGTVFMGVK